MTTYEYKTSYKEIILDGIFCGVFGFFTVFKIFFQKQSNFSEICFFNCLLDFSPCLLILFINIFNIYIDCFKILRCTVSANIISFKINLPFRMTTCFYINTLSICTVFFSNFFIINKFLNVLIGLIWFLNSLQGY